MQQLGTFVEQAVPMVQRNGVCVPFKILLTRGEYPSRYSAVDAMHGTVPYLLQSLEATAQSQVLHHDQCDISCLLQTSKHTN